jgi:threonine/homoserine/homoserine lactone efflux protein
MKRLYKFFSALTSIVLFLFAWISFRAAFEMHKFETALPFTAQRPFLSGVSLSLINPLHLPFWLGWTAVLKSEKYFGTQNRHTISMLSELDWELPLLFLPTEFLEIF